MVFVCLLLSVYATIDEYERVASVILYYMVRIDINSARGKRATQANKQTN